MYRCKRCGKRLTSPESKSRGYGLDCYQKEMEEQSRMLQINLFDIGEGVEKMNIDREIERDCVHACDRCGESLDGREGYYHEDSGMKVCSEKCGEEVFENFEERCDELDIFFTYFGDS